MWCEQCQSDVATEISADGQQLLCTTCRQPVRKVVAPSLHPETKSAREFLERWAREQQALKLAAQKQESPQQETLKPVTDSSKPVEKANEAPVVLKPVRDLPIIEKPVFPVVEAAPAASAAPSSPINKNEEETKTVTQPTPIQHQTETSSADEIEPSSPVDEPVEATAEPSTEAAPAEAKSFTSGRKFRIDGSHNAPTGAVPARPERPARPRHLEKKAVATEAAPPATPPEPPAPPKAEEPSPREPVYRLDDAQPVGQGPHFNPRELAPQRPVYPGRSEAFWGQVLAYAGVGLLTVGTVFVLWGYFGEIEHYASTGWLVTTAGQMLLLLGIVTLVGGGMQQTTHEVTQRIEHLGGRIIRIEESTDKILNAPGFQRGRKRARRKERGDQEAA